MENRITTVFIVDDDASARKGLGRLIQAAGYNVIIYADALIFLNEIREMPNSCIVLDMRMYNLTGSELHKELISKGITIPVIVVTADQDSETRLKAKRAGAAAFFRKPVDGPALLDAIEWTIAQHRQEGNGQKQES